MDRIVLAYSGGLDTSVAIAWLAETYRAEVVAVTLDVGQGRELEDVRARALAIGAVRAHVIDVREEFARDFVLPALQAGALNDDRSPLATALSRPLIARHLVEIARIEGATAIAHGCTRAAPDYARLERSVRAIDPSIRVLAPAHAVGLARAAAIEYARERGLPMPPALESPYTTDVNVWGRSVEGGALEDPWCEAPEEVFLLTRTPADAPDLPAYVEIAFERGAPVSINGIDMGMIELVQCLETIAGAHGVGRLDVVEPRSAGKRSRKIYEAPAAVVLEAAHRELQRFVTPRELDRLTFELAAKYADLIIHGLWHSPMRAAIDTLVAQVQERVTGVVRLKFFKGDCRIAGRRSPHAHADPAASVSDAGDGIDQADGEALLKLWAPQVKTAARKVRAAAKAPAVAGKKS